MKSILGIASLLGTAALLFALAVQPTYAQSVVGSDHDLSSSGPGATSNVGRVCVFCHTPHQPSSATVDPLWNHTISSQGSYGVYNSDTLDATPADIGGATATSASVSNLCMSCHDGTVAVSSLYNEPNELNGAAITITAGGAVDGSGFITGNPLLGIDLSNDHPVNFTYNAALSTSDGGLNDPSSNAVSALLFNGSVQCASCHDAHNNTNVPFLVMSNANSALCTTCHNK